jgi:hypothetical protein
MSKKIAVLKSKNEVVIFKDGSTTISQRKLAKILNINVNTLKAHIFNTHKNANTSKGLDEKTAFLTATYFAYKSKVCTKEAEAFVESLGAGGMRAFNYNQAGYKLQAAPKVPTALEAARETVRALEQIEALETQVNEDAILTAKSDTYYPVSHVRKLNKGIKIKIKELKIMSDELGLPPKQLYGNYEAGRVNTYHVEVWLEIYPEIKL